MEQLKHECGVAMVRLLKPLEYYHQKYGTWMYGLNKLYLLMEKQHNRGQEGAGLACVKLEASPGEEYMFRERALGTGAITEIFAAVHDHYKDLPPGKLNDPLFAKANLPFAGELYMGHLRYSTTGKSGISYVHPFLRRNNWRAKNLALCGNFNLTNVNDIFKEITAIGQHPRKYADTYIMLEQMGHRLDREVERLYRKYEEEGLRGMDITHAIEGHMDLSNVLKRCVPTWDGGFVICGLTGSGESFSVRDPWGIRPAFYYADDEIVVLASERPVIQTAMNVQAGDIKELQRGEAMFISKDGRFRTSQIVEPEENKACSFERIYFSRGSDVDIYRERKKLGENLVHPILKAVDYDIKHTVFSFIPNTAEVAYFGMQEGLNNYLNKLKKEWIADRSHLLQEEELDQILSMRVRAEKVAIKDIKLRTFIAEGNSRNDLAAHVYDITYGSIEPFVDNLVVIDDSIVRGTTLKQSIIGILDRLHPRKIVIVSSSPQVRYPDYYGIDMSRMNEFIAFKAAVALLKERGMESVITEAYWKAKKQQAKEEGPIVNYVKEIYAPFTDEEISAKMVDLLTPTGTRAKVEIVYQTLECLHASCPNHPGDWYFSGDYPTQGGARMVNNAFIHYMEEEYLVK
ncbi:MULTISPECIES: amidophosphoribosyltransferase [Parabacteroides]|uniref:Amidophosphoribosyltransferase n=3 Tax=Pseudomonadati TaxID=3379134 RepID=A0A6G1ZLD5_9BACT|nr:MULTISPECIES: amidophosphoribosyltransferase [Parabacteroides]EOS19459.1 amidophosphoribosyltransferase [Parabacteroides goldsteinii dnLKV18]KAI4360455.1 Amidophosphoribosyltransferase [Parabacteroides sp. ASF519]MBF0767939.1 amidophosphoribosyltransferase [Parabacteroides goldsteinii]MDZ3929044.1 amidophosphoribosyltransferase [Parabacteroides goldsteinii]MRX95221.1 amidophosphoribosyltransferase [Parabacteroides goldsteinii]